jgi:hypothetical protein
MEESVIKFVGTVGIIGLTIFFAPAFGAFSGAFAAWVVALFYPHVMQHLADLTTFHHPYELGAAAGFISGFLPSSIKNSD